MKLLRFVVLILMIIGSLNWGLGGFFGYDVIADILGENTLSAQFLFALVGMAGIYGISFIASCDTGCKCGPNCSCSRRRN